MGSELSTRLDRHSISDVCFLGCLGARITTAAGALRTARRAARIRFALSDITGPPPEAAHTPRPPGTGLPQMYAQATAHEPRPTGHRYLKRADRSARTITFRSATEAPDTAPA